MTKAREMRMRSTSYRTAHDRLPSLVGLLCVSCGRSAEELAYQHSTAPLSRRRVETKGYARGRPFSFDLRDYSPMCLRCHNAYDLVACARGHKIVGIMTTQT